MSNSKWLPEKKHIKCIRNAEISTRVEGDLITFNKFCEDALENKRLDYVGSGNLCSVSQVLLSSDTQLGLFVATGKCPQYSNIPKELLIKMVNDIPQELDIGLALCNEVTGFVGNKGDVDVMLSNYLFSVLLCYLIDTRFKVVTGYDLLDIERRGRYLFPGQLYFCIVETIFNKKDWSVLSKVYRYLLINVNDGSCISTDGRSQQIAYHPIHEEGNIEKEELTEELVINSIDSKDERDFR